jgi:hypothetical protein
LANLAKAKASRSTALANLAKANAARRSGRGKTQAEVVAQIRKKVETKLKQEPKGTLGDYIRLVQLQKELDADEPRDITVTWVESDVER